MTRSLRREDIGEIAHHLLLLGAELVLELGAVEICLSLFGSHGLQTPDLLVHRTAALDRPSCSCGCGFIRGSKNRRGLFHGALQRPAHDGSSCWGIATS